MTRLPQSRHRRILIVGAQTGAERALIDSIEEANQFAIEHVTTAAACLARMARAASAVDAIVLSIDLPDEDGATLCHTLRKRGVHSPILLMATPPGFSLSEAEIVRGLDAGANDVLAPPFRAGEVMARLRAQMRVFESSDDAVMQIGPFQFRPARRIMLNTQTGERIRLTEKEAAVLKFLYRAEAPVPRNALLHEVWGYSADATTHTVETHIYRLRRKIELSRDGISLLVNEHGGYRLRMPIAARPEARQPDMTREAAMT